jgi:hypothetical protein
VRAAILPRASGPLFNRELVMRKFLFTAWVVVLSAASAERAPAEEPKAVIEKSIRSYGGDEKLAKRNRCLAKAKGFIINGSA